MKNEKGFLSPLTITLIFIMLFIVQGMMDIFFTANNTAESIQQTADTAGSAALVAGIEKNVLQEDDISYDIDIIRNTFAKYIAASYDMKGGYPYLTGSGEIKSIEIVFFDVRPYINNNRKNWSFNDGKDRDFLVLETILIARIKTEKAWDNGGTTIFDYTEYGTNIPRAFTLTGQAGDGIREIPVHSVSRIIIR